MVTFLVVFALLSNGVNLLLPKIISRAIDSFSAGNFNFKTVVLEFLVASFVIFFFTYLQSIVQTFASERVAVICVHACPTKFQGKVIPIS